MNSNEMFSQGLSKQIEHSTKDNDFVTDDSDSEEIRRNYLGLVNNKSNKQHDIRNAMEDVGKIAMEQNNSLSDVSNDQVTITYRYKEKSSSNPKTSSFVKEYSYFLIGRLPFCEISFGNSDRSISRIQAIVYIINGDYSVGASGIMIENGEFSYPVSEITIAGNLNNIFQNITLADDLEFNYSTNSPTMHVEGMIVGGK